VVRLKKKRKGPIKYFGKQEQARVIPNPRPNRIHISAVADFVGFVVEVAEKDQMVKVQTRASLISDNPLFYTYMDQITGIFLNKIRVSANSVYQFLVIIHKDLTADLYVNDISVEILMMAKRNLKKGEIVTTGDIADISKMAFIGLSLNDTDKVIYCFKVGWKFGLFFDLDRQNSLDIDTLQKELGALYRYLSFQSAYDTLESKPQFDQLLKDGWFPFIEIIGFEFKEISDAYRKLPDPQAKIKEVISKFDKERIERITSKWWTKKIFLAKKTLIETGINSYLRHDAEGFMACIKTLLTEIEGILWLYYFEETGKGKDVKSNELITYIVEKGTLKSGSDLSLFFPRAFFAYLKESIFSKFDLETGDPSLSRHTSSHGVAKAEDYTVSRALQMILILDQIYFYL